MTALPPSNDAEAATFFTDAWERIRSQVNQVVVGQEAVLEQLMIAVASRSHALLVGVPGLAKTLMVSTFAKALALDFRRIQFTPDLMPADITGGEVLHSDPTSGERSFRFQKGPIFTNILLADEINRTPPKTQAALLEAMQERQVTSSGDSHSLPKPFFTLATQNPLEQEGTYPLPEAALDRFMFFINVDYPSADEEAEILRRTTGDFDANIEPVLDAQSLDRLQDLVRAVPAADSVLEYAVALAKSSRPKDATAPPFVQQWVTWGAGPRASQGLVLAAKARALLQGRSHAAADDIAAMALPVLRHRIQTNFAAEAEGIDSDSVITQLLEAVSAHPKALDKDRATGVGS